MSSTKRGGQRSDADVYATPLWTVHRLLEVEGLDLPGGRWTDPCAGTGNLIQSTMMLRRDIRWKTYEIREECRAGLEAVDADPTIADFLDPDVEIPECDVVFMNPPYRLAQDFIERSLTFTTGYVVALLRLNYLGSDKRTSFMRSRCPDIYVLPNRPSFMGTGQTDSIEYAWMIWNVQHPQTVGTIRILASTPRAERKL